ncbi:MAG: hypothetical protein CME19_04965 [Gemmatimonadetes bacterium]|nr:hypothetical protein [Gemmatimonadota bacterium]|tara:strand:+ start:4700 stop:4942 length:243 start_codon:yes stop_codon:yes gene_type:complete
MVAADDGALWVLGNGRGIDPDHLKRVFDPGFKTKIVGVGLGLATTFQIVQKHRGRIDVESEVGVGSTFSIRLPFCESEDA